MRPASVYANPTCPAGCPCDLLGLLHGRHRVAARLVMILLSPPWPGCCRHRRVTGLRPLDGAPLDPPLQRPPGRWVGRPAESRPAPAGQPTARRADPPPAGPAYGLDGRSAPPAAGPPGHLGTDPAPPRPRGRQLAAAPADRQGRPRPRPGPRRPAPAAQQPA